MAESYVCPDHEGDRKNRHTCVMEMMTTLLSVQVPLLHTRLPKHILAKEVSTFSKDEAQIRSKKGNFGPEKVRDMGQPGKSNQTWTCCNFVKEVSDSKSLIVRQIKTIYPSS